MNTTTITYQHLTETSLHYFVAEASELRLGASTRNWPRVFRTTIGNGLPLALVEELDNKAIYRQEFGCITVSIIND